MLTHIAICFILIQLFRFLRKKKRNDLVEDKEPVLDDKEEGNIQRGKQFFDLHFSDN